MDLQALGWGFRQAWTTIAHVEVIAEEQREAAATEERLRALQINDSDAPGIFLLPPHLPCSGYTLTLSCSRFRYVASSLYSTP